MFGRLLPRETSFFDFFEQHATLTLESRAEMNGPQCRAPEGSLESCLMKLYAVLLTIRPTALPYWNSHPPVTETPSRELPV